MGTNQADPNAGGGTSEPSSSEASRAIDEAQARDTGGSGQISGGKA